MPKTSLSALGHEELRKIVCICCMRKGDRCISQTDLTRLKVYFISNLDLSDSRFPCGICNTCRRILQKLEDGNYGQDLPEVFDFSTIQVKRVTKSSPVCDCLLCTIAKAKKPSDHPLLIGNRAKGRPVAKEQEQGDLSFSFRVSPPTPVKICPSCLTLPKAGHPHHCTPGTRRENIFALAQPDPKGAGGGVAVAK